MGTNAERRNILIRLIHVARSKSRVCACGRISFRNTCPSCGKETFQMPDHWYRGILEEVAGFGKDSCPLLSTTQLQAVLDVFNTAGFEKKSGKVKPKADYLRREDQMRNILQKQAWKAFGGAWEKRLLGYVKKKFGKECFDALYAEEIRDVLGFVHRTQKREAAKEAAQYGTN